jgi:aspartate-semialdehyde dehydrogenase
MKQRRIAITHANSLFAEAILEKLPEFEITSDSVVLLDDESHVGVRLAYADSYLKIQDKQKYDYSDCALVLMLQYDRSIEDKLSNLDAILLSHTLQDDDQPVFAANADAKLNISYSQQSLKLAGAELSCLLGVLPVLHQNYSITHVNTVLMRSAEAKPRIYPLQIAFNLIPEASHSRFNQDLAGLIGDDAIKCTHQVVDVPVFHGFSAAVQLIFDSEVDLQACQSILKSISKVQLKSSAASPITDCNRSFECVINRLEQAPNKANTLQFWMIADPIRYGLANNYVNVADILLKSFL